MHFFRSFFVVVVALFSAGAFATSERSALRDAIDSDRVSASDASDGTTRLTASSFAEAATLFKTGTVPTAADLAGWHAGVYFYDNKPYLPIATILNTSVDGKSLPQKIFLATNQTVSADYYYSLDATKKDDVLFNIQKKIAGYTVAQQANFALVSYFSGTGHQFANAARKTADGRLVVASYEVNAAGGAGLLLGVGVYDKRVHPGGTTTLPDPQAVLLGALAYKGGFANNLSLSLKDTRTLSSFSVVIPGFCAAVEALEATVHGVDGSKQKVTKSPDGVFALKLPVVVKNLVVTANGPEGKNCTLPVYGSFIVAPEQQE